MLIIWEALSNKKYLTLICIYMNVITVFQKLYEIPRNQILFENVLCHRNNQMSL